MGSISVGSLRRDLPLALEGDWHGRRNGNELVSSAQQQAWDQLLMSFCRTFNFLIGFFTSAVTDRIHYGLGWVFAGAIICGAWFVWFFVHETAGKSLEAIDREILDGVKPWNSKKGE
jgi:hypothetical protein